MNYYQKLTLRNGFFIDKKLQGRIKGSTLVFIGCGLASSVALSCARLGFEKFILVDGDDVEVSNLNRQDFYLDDIGKNKARVISKRLALINPEIKTEVVQKHISSDEVEEIISRGDIVINSADFDEVTYRINEVANEQNKLSISPLNIGFGTVTTAFTKKSATLYDLTEGLCANDRDYLIKINKNLDYTIPNYLKNKMFKAFAFIALKGFFPQNIIAAHSSCIAIEHTIIRYLGGNKIKEAPGVIAFDLEGLYEEG